MKPEIENLPKSFNEILAGIPGVFWGKSVSTGLPQEGAQKSGLQFPRGAIAQVVGTHGSGKTETVLRFLSESSGPVAWLEDEFTLYPAAFPQYGVSLDRVFFVDFSQFKKDVAQMLRVIQQVVTSRAFGACILRLDWERYLKPEEQGTALRRIQLAAEKAETSVVLISEKAAPSGGSWPIAMQVLVKRDPEGKPELQVVKSKTSVTGPVRDLF